MAPKQFPDTLMVLLFNTNKKKPFQTQMHFHQRSLQSWSYPYIDTDTQSDWDNKEQEAGYL